MESSQSTLADRVASPELRYDTYYAAAVSLAFRILWDTHDAEDVPQQVSWQSGGRSRAMTGQRAQAHQAVEHRASNCCPRNIDASRYRSRPTSTRRTRWMWLERRPFTLTRRSLGGR